MIRVCHVTSVHRSTDPRIFHKECVSLAKAGYEVVLVAPGTGEHVEQGVRIVGAGEVPASRRERMFRYAGQVVEMALAQKAELLSLIHI